MITSSVVLGNVFPEPTRFLSSLNTIALRSKRDVEEIRTNVTNNSTTDATSDTNSHVCNKKQFDEYHSDLDVCKTEATQNFSDAYWEQENNHFHSIESDKALCNKYVAQASCYTNRGPRKLNCFGDEINQRKRIKFLYGIWKELSNDTSKLGKDFIDSCSAFSNFKADFLRIVAGCENCCSFEDYVKKDSKVNDCYTNATLTYEKRVDIINAQYILDTSLRR